ncbi:MAG: plasmid pRiA4b ORF-3 family protein [Oscillochloris sp.]|nr:plasmid pRiA4b ORF-3 family protein [Oscillochloris sp.]
MSPAERTAAFQLLLTLDHLDPPIWRRVIVDPDRTLADLHTIIQCVMPWQNSHLHRFTVRDTEYGVPHPSDFAPIHDERTLTLRAALSRIGAKIRYVYDFGDDWQHTLQLEARLPTPAPLPQCVDGANACPPEDCGGPWGYVELLDALADPDHPDHDEKVEWIGDSFDPEAFDRDAANRSLEAALPLAGGSDHVAYPCPA